MTTCHCEWCIVQVNIFTNVKWFAQYQCGTVHAPDSHLICRYSVDWVNEIYPQLIKDKTITLDPVDEDDYPFAKHP